MYTKNLKNERLKLVFKYKITFWICVLLLWIHKGYWIVKKLVWNVRTKVFWYTNNLKYLLFIITIKNFFWKLCTILCRIYYSMLYNKVHLNIVPTYLWLWKIMSLNQVKWFIIILIKCVFFFHRRLIIIKIKIQSELFLSFYLKYLFKLLSIRWNKQNNY